LQALCTLQYQQLTKYISDVSEQNNTNGTRPERKRNGSRKGKGNISLEIKAEMAAALPELGTQSAVAQAFGVSHDVVSKALANPDVAKLAKVKKEEIAAGFASLTQKLLKRYEDLADSATLTDKGVVLLGICADKALLYAGEPNNITESRRTLSREEAEAILAEYERRFGADRALSLFREDDPELASTLVQ
jgi:hypothetical protein